ncbi:MAG: hemerythrin domain-containing protein [Chloroflexi bacterium]|nr:hemerythrin domain-containing protein [Chloroflexota bacterium]
MLTEHFTQIFREEHRKVRDGLLDLVQAFQARDRARILYLLNELAILTGPHFRYEEEALYPSLVVIFGESYIEQLVGDHDRAIANAGRLIELAAQDPLTDDNIAEALRLVRKILPHVSDCDGLSIMVERLPEAQVQSILDTRKQALHAGLGLLQWSSQVRGRPPVMPG